jgi:hypothetical protein
VSEILIVDVLRREPNEEFTYSGLVKQKVALKGKKLRTQINGNLMI